MSTPDRYPLSPGKLPASKDKRTDKVPMTQRAHSTGHVQDGGQIVRNPTAGVNARMSSAMKRTQQVFAPHPSMKQYAGKNGNPVDRTTPPQQPVDANPSKPKALPQAFTNSGMRTTHEVMHDGFSSAAPTKFDIHRLKEGAQVLAEGLPSHPKFIATTGKVARKP